MKLLRRQKNVVPLTLRDLNERMGELKPADRSDEWPGIVTFVGTRPDDRPVLSGAAEFAFGLRFPWGVEGYLEPWEGQALYTLAVREVPSDHAIVELGSYKGRSTICLAQSERWVLAVDQFASEDAPGAHADHAAGTYEAAFDENLDRFGASQFVTKHVGDTHGAGAEDAFAALDRTGTKVGMVFIDAGHKYEDVKADVSWWAPLVEPGGLMVFDDAPMPPVHRVIEECLAEGWERAGMWGAVRAIRKVR